MSKVGIIGFGNMGSAIAERIKSKYTVYVFDKDKNKTANLTGIKIADNILDLVRQVESVILAIKPQDVDDILNGIKGCAGDKLIISIAAGISTGYIEKQLDKARVIRAMPNMGAKIGESVTCICAGRLASGEDLSWAQELLGCLGKTREIKEAMMNASTAISGSGPGYIFEYFDSEKISGDVITQDIKENIIQRLAQSAESLGFNKDEAMFLAVNTSNTSINLIKKTGLTPAELRRQVCSKGGTTEAALEVIRSGGSWKDAAKAAVARAKELSKEG